MANVVWAEIGQAIMDELGSVVFAAGKTDEFRHVSLIASQSFDALSRCLLQNHEITEALIRALECLAPSVQSIETMRAHPVYTAFQQRWQIHTYFQLRWKEIVVKLEEALVPTKLDTIKGTLPPIDPWPELSSHTQKTPPLQPTRRLRSGTQFLRAGVAKCICQC